MNRRSFGLGFFLVMDYLPRIKEFDEMMPDWLAVQWKMEGALSYSKIGQAKAWPAKYQAMLGPFKKRDDIRARRWCTGIRPSSSVEWVDGVCIYIKLAENGLGTSDKSWEGVQFRQIA